MSPKIIFTEKSFKQYNDWIILDIKMFNKINTLIKDIVRNGPMDGLGKPEKLRGKNGVYSRRINSEHRLTYTISLDNYVQILSCKYHYKEK